MTQTFVTNPSTGRRIQVGKTTFNQLIFDAYDYINGELVRRESAPPIPFRTYYYNILTGRRVLDGSRRFRELIEADWEIEEDPILQDFNYLIPPWIPDDDAQELMNYRRQLHDHVTTSHNPITITYEQIMAAHGNTLANLGVSLCCKCFIPIGAKNEAIAEYCEDCKLN